MSNLHSHQFRAMGSPCSVFIYCDSVDQKVAALEAVVKDVERLEQKYSRFRADSLLSQINAQAGKGSFLIRDEETQALLNYAEQAWRQSGGLFDITAGKLSKLWDFKKARVPNEEDIQQALSVSGWEKLTWQSPHLIIPSGMSLDLGGVVKEYAADCAVSALKSQSIHSALVELGGDIAVVGERADGKPWRVGLKHPRKSGAHRHLGLSGGALASSGDYERFFEYQGRRYSHVINPKTARPSAGPAAVSVIADSCVIAGTAATVAMCSDEAGAGDWLESLGLPYVCVLQNGKVEERL